MLVYARKRGVNCEREFDGKPQGFGDDARGVLALAVCPIVQASVARSVPDVTPVTVCERADSFVFPSSSAAYV